MAQGMFQKERSLQRAKKKMSRNILIPASLCPKKVIIMQFQFLKTTVGVPSLTRFL